LIWSSLQDIINVRSEAKNNMFAGGELLETQIITRYEEQSKGEALIAKAISASPLQLLFRSWVPRNSPPAN